MSLSAEDEYRPTEDEDYMNKRQLTYFKQQLICLRRELVVATNTFVQTLRETATRKPDPVDQSASNTDMALDFQTRYRQQQLIQEIDYALVKIEEGEYGYCEISGEEIGLKRLLARPIATMCIEVQERYERTASRPARCAVPCVV